MKSLKYILAIAISVISASSFACGPDYYELPRPNYLRLSPFFKDEDTRTENLLLWQSQTSKDVKLADIEAVIYGDVKPTVWGPYNSSYYDNEDGPMHWEYQYGEDIIGKNTFLNYLYNTHDDEAFSFIMMAKHVEKLREDRNSPWYYPGSKWEVSEGFEPVIKSILYYKGKRFYNRYSLQLIRAYFASARYEECIKAFEERFANVPDTDLMKRLSRDYAAGAALRIGDSQKATDYFASTGDVESLNRFGDCDNPFETAALGNPDSPKLFGHIEQQFNGQWDNYFFRRDSTEVKENILPTARKIVKMKNVKSRAMWYYILAVGEGEFNNDYASAYRYIKEAAKYSSDRFADNIHGYRIVVETSLGKNDNLLANLKWLESKIADVTSVDQNYWEQVMQNVIFTRIAPCYDKHGDVITALQLANYGDNMPLNYSTSCRRYSGWYGDWQGGDLLQARRDPSTFNYHDFSNSFFQYLTMQTPETIERYIASLSTSSPLAAYLNSRGYTSRDYLYDVAGTLYLAKCDYASAVRVLSKISDGYQKLLNVDRQGFMRREPFAHRTELQMEDWYKNGHSYMAGPGPKDNIKDHKKLYFAREMLRLDREIRTTNDPSKRGLARLKYAIGLNNSFNSCWALTSYQRGWCLVAAPNELTDWDKLGEDDWPHHSDYYERVSIINSTEYANRMIDQALEEITDTEALAEAHYLLGNVRTIARRYPNTAVGKMMAAECDAWSDWIRSPLLPQKRRTNS